MMDQSETSRRPEERDEKQTRKSRDNRESSTDMHDHRKPSPLSERSSSSSGTGTLSDSYGQGSSTQGRTSSRKDGPSQYGWSSAEYGASSRSLSADGQKNVEPSKTGPTKSGTVGISGPTKSGTGGVPGLMDDLRMKSSSLKTAPVCGFAVALYNALFFWHFLLI